MKDSVQKITKAKKAGDKVQTPGLQKRKEGREGGRKEQKKGGREGGMEGGREGGNPRSSGPIHLFKDEKTEARENKESSLGFGPDQHSLLNMLALTSPVWPPH
jgi:hypothetical protein